MIPLLFTKWSDKKGIFDGQIPHTSKTMQAQTAVYKSQQKQSFSKTLFESRTESSRKQCKGRKWSFWRIKHVREKPKQAKKVSGPKYRQKVRSQRVGLRSTQPTMRNKKCWTKFT